MHNIIADTFELAIVGSKVLKKRPSFFSLNGELPYYHDRFYYGVVTLTPETSAYFSFNQSPLLFFLSPLKSRILTPFMFDRLDVNGRIYFTGWEITAIRDILPNPGEFSIDFSNDFNI